jgi:hypothetical protein
MFVLIDICGHSLALGSGYQGKGVVVDVLNSDLIPPLP